MESSDLSKKRFSEYRFLKVTYLTLIIFILETSFFHIFNYIYDYFNATLIISYVILGMGLGAFVSSKIEISEKELFVLCSMGTIFSLYIAIVKLILFASAGFFNFIFLFVFLFPAIYITQAYTKCKSSKIYLFDMFGCFLAVVFIVLLYKLLVSETILFLILSIIPLIALISLLQQKTKYKKLLVLVFIIFIILGLFLFYNQIALDKYNFYRMINCDYIERGPEGARKIFCTDENLVKTYDNIVGRIDVTSKEKEVNKEWRVSFDGWINDIFDTRKITENTYLENKNKTWPTLDIRYLYGVIKEPEILIIGSSAQGLLKTIRKITPIEKITAIEINPAIVRMMKVDFVEESGNAYLNLNPIIGNGISFLKSTHKKYDMITLMNVHTYRNLCHIGPPDYLHITETYELLFEHLTEDGYLMFEERAECPASRLVLYRQINTLWHTLKSIGVENPSDHFVIWSWRYGDGNYKKYDLLYFVGFAVFRNPIKRNLINPWIDKQLEREKFHLDFINNYNENPKEFIELFDMIESNNFSPLEREKFDASITTNNRPFLSQAKLESPKLNELISNISIIALAFWFIFTIPLIKSDTIKVNLRINLYYILIGLAFFFIEIVLFQVYQNVFLSPSISFVFVLGTLLLSSGIGGYFSYRFNLKAIIIFLIPVSLIAINLPDWILDLKTSIFLVKVIGISSIALSGFFMGMYFPKGLNFAKASGLRNKIYYFFAINAAAGCFAVVLALYLGIKIGYMYTISFALVFYLIASFILENYK